MLRGGMISLQTPYFVIQSDAAGFTVRLQRTAVAYPDIATMERDMDAIVAALDRLGRDRKGICIDLREGPMRNDAPFEEAMRRAIPRFLRGYRAVAVIVRTAVGALQVKRHLREGNVMGEVFQDEPDAMDYLRGSGGVVSRRPTPIPPPDRSAQTNSRGERMSTAQLQAVDRTPPTVSSRGDRSSSLPPLPSERPPAGNVRSERMSSLPPMPSERTSQLPTVDDRPSSIPIPPPARPPRAT